MSAGRIGTIFFKDNASTDQTVPLLKEIAPKDKAVKIIVNSRNFGHLRSPYYALFQTKGDCVVLIASDLQDSPYLIEDFVKKWEEGFKIVKAVKTNSQETLVMSLIIKLYSGRIFNWGWLPLLLEFSSWAQCSTINNKSLLEKMVPPAGLPKQPSRGEYLRFGRGHP